MTQTERPGRWVGEVVARLESSGAGSAMRVMAVEWTADDPGDGSVMAIDTSAFLDCPTSGCRWSFDPEISCPDHGERGDA